MNQLKRNGKPDKRFNKGTMTETIVEVSPILPTRHGHIQMVLLPVKIIDGCISNVR